MAELELKIRSPRPRSRSTAFNVDRLRDRETQNESRRRLSVFDGAGRETCGDLEALHKRITSAARQTLGVAVSGRRRWTLPSEVADLVNRRRHARLTGDTPLYRSLRGEVTRALRDAEEARVGSRGTCLRAIRDLYSRLSRLCMENSVPHHRPQYYQRTECPGRIRCLATLCWVL